VRVAVHVGATLFLASAGLLLTQPVWAAGSALGATAPVPTTAPVLSPSSADASATLPTGTQVGVSGGVGTAPGGGTTGSVSVSQGPPAPTTAGAAVSTPVTGPVATSESAPVGTPGVGGGAASTSPAASGGPAAPGDSGGAGAGSGSASPEAAAARRPAAPDPPHDSPARDVISALQGLLPTVCPQVRLAPLAGCHSPLSPFTGILAPTGALPLWALLPGLLLMAAGVAVYRRRAGRTPAR
jgi:hypothetical protein